MSIKNQIWAAQELESIYTEWLINPMYPEDSAGEFDKVMELISYFIVRDNG